MRNTIPALLIGLFVLALVQIACAAPITAPTSTGAPTATFLPAPTLPLGNTPAAPEFCPAVDQSPAPSGIITTLTLARGTEGEAKNPVDVTTTFGASDTIHAVATIQNAPRGTVFKAVWWAVTIPDDPAACNMKITEYEITTEGTRNIDFSLTSDSSWPAGTYKVEIYVNGTLDQVAHYSVQ
ncbi:hypothetical protein ATHL_03570 [Anaerolinea thermolimosa]|uniref:Uncharacterized protein n=1 Tax=Anaerolinea thermolimosa TaxID=229919 RepID=A0A7U9KMN8_9CHLR|nr:hypothetical protein [Anaerolinea thermolimosa]GAP08664.1 hypothetical protein ATHL_03570 [Anaerolinea thermolimosa]